MLEKRVFVRCEDHDVPMVVAYPDDLSKPVPCMLLLHGYMAYKEGDGYLFRKTAEELAKNGIATARIDFVSMGENRYSRKNYGMVTMLKEVKVSFAYLCEDEKIDSSRIGILGHSLGGRVTWLSASLPSKCLVAFNGAVNVRDKNMMKQPASFTSVEGTEYTLVNTSDGRTELLFPRFYEEMASCTNEDIYSYTNPVLVCVGANDPTLPPQVSYSFVEECGMENVEMLVIDNANHTFNAKTGDYTKVYELLSKLNPWLDEHLKQ
ncbi:MAG: prolyl oligopeptidase family serine peptidase [Erysipelotrichaceae bacterium]|nr:prolyl oligopeptidase family serine peptidase [Erysipelotrichaceae bacterium]